MKTPDSSATRSEPRRVSASRIAIVLCVLLPCAVAAGIDAATSASDTVIRSGGDNTVDNATRNAYSLPSAGMPLQERLNFSVGNSFFRNTWVIAPSSTAARDGLGALYNTNACQNCHIKDGRGHPPEANAGNAVSMLVRMSIPPGEPDAAIITRDGALGDPNYGGQLQDFAVPGVQAEGQIRMHYDEREVALPGELVHLRRPTVEITDLAYGPLHEHVMLSARIASPMIGLGMLEAVPEATLDRYADPDDADGDGISGRKNSVWNHDAGEKTVGRFGWKAGQPTVRQQAAAAFNGDLGITSGLFRYSNCTPSQIKCRSQPDGGDPEVSDEILEQVAFYSRNLAVPARRNSDDPVVRHGMQLFAESGCAGCHIPAMVTGESRDPWLSNQKIAPYTDLLLHDMGEGLADHRPEFDADGREWRTPPLWGIGLADTVSSPAFYLHDGRARTLLEAVLWHDGEAATARRHVERMTPQAREALLAFLRSL